MITNCTLLLKTCINDGYYNPSLLKELATRITCCRWCNGVKRYNPRISKIYIFSAPLKNLLRKWPKCLPVINLLSQSFSAWIDLPNKKSSLVWRTKSNLYARVYKKIFFRSFMNLINCHSHRTWIYLLTLYE